MYFRGPVRNKHWMEYQIRRIRKHLEMYQKGMLPPAIEGWMLSIPLKGALRSIYGKTNLGVALVLLWEALVDWAKFRWWGIAYRLRIYKL